MAGWAMAYPVWGTTCHQITSRVGGKMWTPWCVELESHAYHFVFVSVFVFVFVFDLSSSTLMSRVGGKMWTPWCVELELHAYHFVFVSVFVFVFVSDLSSGTLRSRVVGVRYVHPGVQLESHAYHLSQPGGRGGVGDPLPGCETLSGTSSHTNWLLSPPAPFSLSAWSSWSSSLWMWSRRECEEDLIVIRCGGL